MSKNQKAKKAPANVVIKATMLQKLKELLLENARGVHIGPTAKPVVNLTTGEIFKSVHDAYELAGYNRARVSEAAREVIEFYRGERWSYVENTERCAQYMLGRYPEARIIPKPKAKISKPQAKSPKKVIIRKVVRR